MKRRKISESLFNTLYFLSVTIFAYFVLRDKPWFPVELGGQGLTYFSGYPNQLTTWPERWYFFLNGGYRLYLGLSLCYLPRMPDFYDNLVQVVMSTALIFLSYRANYIRVGTVLMFLHDFCDVFIAFVKTTAECKMDIVSVPSALVTVGMWSYLRLYCFLVAVVYPVYTFARGVDFAVPGGPFMGLILLCLLMMNIYWFTLLVRSIIHYVRSGKVADFHSMTNKEEQVIKKTG
eukprot:GHVO01033517.1.p1 GENE.GHVO01033517.1~~GHVO01033517.1.p1  ORF type:complete len:233 (-),score=10.19 GHVO01033517.1:97-795(-)